jgi:hypothetical protein
MPNSPTLIARTLPDSETLAPPEPRIRGLLMDMPGPEWSPFEARFTTPQAAIVAGAEVATLLSWRRKYGFLTEGQLRFGQKGTAFQHSLIDLFLMRLAVVMVEHGIGAKDAAWFAGSADTPKEHRMGTLMLIGELLADRQRSGLVAFHRGGSDKHPNDPVTFYLLDLDKTMRELAIRIRGPVFTVVDLQGIINHVLLMLGVEIVARDIPKKK